MIAVAASLGRPALVVASSGRVSGKSSKGKRFEAKFGAKVKDAKKKLDKMLDEAKESFEKFEKMHKERVDKLGDIAKGDIEVVREAFDVEAAHEWGGDEEREDWSDAWDVDAEETIDVEFIPHNSRGRNDK